MITITVETDEEEAVIVGAIRNGALPADARIRRPDGGGGEFASEPFGPYQIPPEGGSWGGSGSSSMVHHAHGAGDSCNTGCVIIGGGGGVASAPGGAGGGPGGGWTGARP